MLLAGGGHAHLRVLTEFAKQPLNGWQVDLVSPQEHQIYSGMLPGWIAGHHALQDCLVPLRPLAERAGIAFHLAAGTALDMSCNALHCDNGRSRSFDVLSLDVGPAPALDSLMVQSLDVLPVRPLAGLVDAWPRLMGRIAGQCKPFHLVIVGAGAGGLELAFSVRHRGMREGWSHLRVTLVGSAAQPLDGAPEDAGRRALRLMKQRCVEWRGQHRVTRIEDKQVYFEAQPPLAFDECWLATGAAAPAWLGGSGLALDAHGYVCVNNKLQAVGHPQVFAAGDVAALSEASRSLPKSGVYAVRAGPPLAHNLRALVNGTSLRNWTPQEKALYLVSTGDRHALGMWGGWSWQGRWAWHWKTRIDRAFVTTYVR